MILQISVIASVKLVELSFTNPQQGLSTTAAVKISIEIQLT